MESPGSKTPNLCWEVSPNGSKWLADNLKQMDQSVKRMLKLIEEDGSDANEETVRDQSTKPELIASVEGFYQLYRSLAERYEYTATKEMCSDQETPNVKARSGGSDTSPRSIGADSVFSLKEGSESASQSSSDSDSESFVTSYLRTPLSINSQTVHQKIAELESELSSAKADLEIEKERVSELQGTVAELEARLSDAESKIGISAEELEAARDLVVGSEEEIGNLKCERDRLRDQLELASKEKASLEAQLDSEKGLVLELEEMVGKYEADLSDRDLEVWELKVAQGEAEEHFLQEKARLSEKHSQLETELRELEEKAVMIGEEKIELQKVYEAQVIALQTDLAAQRTQIEAVNKDFDSLKLKYDTVRAEKDATSAKIDDLVASLIDRDNHIREMDVYLSRFRERHDELVEEYEKARELVGELRVRVDELQSEVDEQREVISDGAEEKREAIRQLCFSIEFYRNGYQELRQAFVGNRRNVVMAA